MNHFSGYLKLIQHCKSIILPKKKKKRNFIELKQKERKENRAQCHLPRGRYSNSTLF